MESELWKEFIADRSEENRNRLIVHHAPLVMWHARRMWRKLSWTSNGRVVELGDLFSAGIFGLSDAIGTFDPEKGVTFKTYSGLRIRGAMQDSLREFDWVPRLERAREKRGEAEPIKLSSLDAVVEGDQNRDMIREHVEPAAGEEDRTGDDLDREDFWRVILRGLSKRERLVILLYYRCEMTQKAIGENLGVSESRIYQIHQDVLEGLRRRHNRAV